MAAKAILGASGAEGTQRLIIPDDDKIVASANMKVGAYTIAAQPTAPSILGVLATAVGTADTMGTLVVVGTSPSGIAQSETVIPIAGTTVNTVYAYASVTSITGAGWVIDAGSGNDTIKVGVVTSAPEVNKYFSAIQAVTDTVVASQTNVSGFPAVAFSGLTKIPAGHVLPCKCLAIALTSGEAVAYVTSI
jgi:hypothetical protein